MAATYYSTRRPAGQSSSATWARNHNAVRHRPDFQLGPVFYIIFISVFVSIAGLIYLTQSSKVTSYDLAIASVNSEITDLEAQRDALAVENAKITAAAADEDKNKVASTMVDAGSADFVKE